MNYFFKLVLDCCVQFSSNSSQIIFRLCQQKVMDFMSISVYIYDFQLFCLNYSTVCYCSWSDVAGRDGVAYHSSDNCCLFHLKLVIDLF